MRRRQRNRVLLITVLLAAVAITAIVLASSAFLAGRLLRGAAGSRGAVDWVTFAGWSEQATVHLQWETASENGILGFNLFRSDTGAGPYELLNPELIPSLDPGEGGATYDFVDSVVVEGETYSYRLEAMNSGGSVAQQGPLSVTVFPISSLPPTMNWRVFLPLVARQP